MAIRSGRLLALGCSVLPGFAFGADPGAHPSVWINPGIYSEHFDRSKDLRNDNVGFGAEALLGSDHALAAGSFINSNRQRTHYGAYEWRPLHWKVAGLNVSPGIAIGAFNGYPHYHDGGWFLAPLPVVSIEGTRLGANLSLIPTIPDRLDGALAIQVKLRVW